MSFHKNSFLVVPQQKSTAVTDERNSETEMGQGRLEMKSTKGRRILPGQQRLGRIQIEPRLRSYAKRGRRKPKIEVTIFPLLRIYHLHVCYNGCSTFRPKIFWLL